MRKNVIFFKQLPKGFADLSQGIEVCKCDS